MLCLPRKALGLLALVPPAFLLLLAATRALPAQQLSARDSALVSSILLAEDGRNVNDSILTRLAAHPDARVRLLARRAVARITDPKFVTRTEFPALAPSPVWPEPAWRLRLRGLTALRDDCAAIRMALADSAWPVRLRASDVVRASCADDRTIVATLRDWVDQLPASTTTRTAGAVSWHAGAHAIVALARLQPAEARARMARVATHSQPQVRQYAVRAAVILSDTLRVRALAEDIDDNVADVAIEQLARLTGHADDAISLRALDRKGAQVIKTAATALKGSTRDDVVAKALEVFATFVARDNSSEKDARVALLAVAGRPASDDHAPRVRPEDTAWRTQATGLVLGAEVRLRVTMDQGSGGGSFVVRLRGDAAPIMGARLLALARAGYYNGLTWHRVEHDFVVQGGSPGANEYIGYERYLRDELGGVPHLRGTVGMSTRGHDTGDAQWFINLRDNTRLDPDYTVWAEVVSGIETVDGILEGDRIARIEELSAGRE